MSRALNSDEIQVREVGIRTIWDNRDEVGWPTKGMIVNVETSWADFVLGGDTKYFHWLFGLGKYFKLTQNLVFASRARFESFSNVLRSEN